MQDSRAPYPIFSTSSFYTLLILSFIVSFIGLFIPIMEVDAAQYASMSLEMLKNKSFLQVTDLAENYLDKPPLLFWLSSASIYIFGNTSFAFKLPSFVLAWISVYALYQWVKIYYDKQIAQLSSLVYSCSVAFLLFTNDIRTDTNLIAFVILSVYFSSAWLNKQSLKYALAAFASLGFALLAKGPIGLMVPVLGLFPHILLKGQIKKLFHWHLLLAPIVILVILSPMIWGLYQQWGLHGIQFFFWEQSFGRITGENVWKNDATHFYFLHNIIWAVLPFTIFFILGLFNFIKTWKLSKEYISFFGLILPFIALSFSQYKLPHYIYVVVPFASVLGALFIQEYISRNAKYSDLFISLIQIPIVSALLIVPILLSLAFPPPLLLVILYIVGVLFILAWVYKLQFSKKAIIGSTISTYLLGALLINLHGYPSLLAYQGSSEAAFFIRDNNPQALAIYQQNIWWRAFHYYADGPIPSYEDVDSDNDIWVLTDEDGKALFSSDSKAELLKTFPHYNVTRLSIDFLNPATRQSKLKTLYLYQIHKTP